MNSKHLFLPVGRSLSIALICVLTCSGVRAQQVWSYHFASAPFVSSPPGGAVLQPIDTITTPVTVMIPATTCPDTPTVVLSRFSRNGGFAAKSFFSSTYSVEMIFQFDDLSGYRRIIDFSNGTSDY